MSAASLPVVVHHWTAVSSAGTGVDALVGSLAARRGGLRRNDFPGCQLDAWIGRVSDDTLGPLPARLGPLDSRNNRLCHAGLQTDGFREVARAAVRRFGAARVGVIIGTSTSSIGRTEEGYARLDAEDRFPPPWIQPEVQNPHSPAHLVALLTGAGGPDMTIGTACSSSRSLSRTP
jgi:3-oxoacyl-[acyl-carrier-protein] synthase-1